MTEDDKTVRLESWNGDVCFSSELGEHPQKIRFVLNTHRLSRAESSAVGEPSGPAAAHARAEPRVTPAGAQPHHPRLSRCSHWTTHPSESWVQRCCPSHAVLKPAPRSIWSLGHLSTLPALVVTSLPFGTVFWHTHSGSHPPQPAVSEVSSIPLLVAKVVFTHTLLSRYSSVCQKKDDLPLGNLSRGS